MIVSIGGIGGDAQCDCDGLNLGHGERLWARGERESGDHSQGLRSHSQSDGKKK